VPKPFAGMALTRPGGPAPHDAVTEPPITITDATFVVGGGGSVGDGCGLVVVVVLGVDPGAGVAVPEPAPVFWVPRPEPVDVPIPAPVFGAPPAFVAFGFPDPRRAASGDDARAPEVSDPDARFVGVWSRLVARRAARMDDSPTTGV